jgi:hypothetical protein
MKIKDIIKNDQLTLGQLKSVSAIVAEWLVFDSDYTLDVMLNDQTKSFADHCAGAYKPEVIKIERLEWTGNYAGRKNDYHSDLTVWVTAIVDMGHNYIVRLSYDLLDSLMMTSDTGCSGHIWEPQH